MLIPILILAGAVLVLILHILQKSWAYPVLAIVNRWLRCLVFSSALAFTIQHLGWTGRPFWLLWVTALLGWLLVESLYIWLAIRALSLSQLSLFPRFEENRNGEEWPAARRFLHLRDWLRGQGYRLVQALRAEVGGGVILRASIYESSDQTTRLQILFLPQTSSTVGVCYQFSSQDAEGIRLVTDNFFLPFGGFYPENWRVDRRPWTHSPARLLRQHQKRCAQRSAPFVAWENPPLEEINRQQRELEMINTELGFLFPHNLREEYGKMTHEGRYRVWTEIFLLNYFGRAHRY